MTEADWVLIDAALEAGAKLEEFGPGIVVRPSATHFRSGAPCPKFVTLRQGPGNMIGRDHLFYRGSDERDFGAPLINLFVRERPDEILKPIDPYSYEELTE